MKKPITIEEHQAFRESLIGNHGPVEIDELAADPIHDRRPQTRAKHQVNRVLSILDELDKEPLNRRCERS